MGLPCRRERLCVHVSVRCNACAEEASPDVMTIADVCMCGVGKSGAATSQARVSQFPTRSVSRSLGEDVTCVLAVCLPALCISSLLVSAVGCMDGYNLT